MKLLFLILFLILALDSHGKGSTPPTKTGNACESDSYCTYGDMPLQNQGALTLKWYLNKKTGNMKLWDPGWCGAVAGMMALYGIKKHNPKVKWNSWMDDKTDNHYGVWKIGVDSGTNFKNGGTYTAGTSNAINNLVNKATNVSSKYFASSGSPYDNSSSIKAEIKSNKHVEYLSICKYKIEYKRSLTPNWNYDPSVKTRQAQVGYYEVVGENESCHALALNGYDGDKLIIYDPWGRVYTVSMDSIFYGRQGSNAVFADPRTRVIYGNYKTRTWDNFNHYVTGSGEQKTQTLLTHRIKFRVSQP